MGPGLIPDPHERMTMTTATHSKGLVVVTGGAGFIGSHLVEALLADGHRVRVVDNLATGHRANLAHLGDAFEWLEGDLADFETCRQAVEGAEAVLHQAAIPSVPRSVREPLGSHASGPTATLNILEASRASGTVRRVVFAASSSAYGDTETLPKHEAMLPMPLSPYAAGKLAGEHYVSVYAKTMGLDAVSLRYFNVFGPRQDPSSPYSGVISLFVRAMAEGRSPTILGDGHQTRDFTYVANVVRANLLALRSDKPLGGAVYNVGTGRRISLRQLVDAINDALGTSLAPEFGPPRDGDVRDSQADLTAIRSDLGFEPAVDFEDGLRRTVSWMTTTADALG
jgi:UDP-glucose 4-epimerase